MSHIIYKPKGPAAEYTTDHIGAYQDTLVTGWAANLHLGCPGGCKYCYRNHGSPSRIIGGSEVRLKKTAGATEEEAYKNFCHELVRKKQDIGTHPLFFSFTTDPLCDECAPLTLKCVLFAIQQGVRCRLLTKFVDWINLNEFKQVMSINPHLVEIGITLTGCDEEEPGAPPNLHRITTLARIRSKYGVATWASIEPILKPQESLRMIQKCLDLKATNTFRIGIASGIKLQYTPEDILLFKEKMDASDAQIYWKQSLIKYINH